MKKKAISAFSISLALAASLFLTSCTGDGGSADEGDSGAASNGGTEAPVTEITEAETSVPPVFDERQNSDIHRGELILVNRDYEYDEFLNPDIVNIYENKNEYYKVDRSDMRLDRVMIGAINSMMEEFYKATGITNVIANSGYRAYEEQKEMYDEDLENTGLTESVLVAPPGHSEHHTGLAMDFAVDDGESYPALRDEDEYHWIYENAHRFGLILRYTEQNKHITGYMAESWHFRYVGPVHASIIKRMGVAYEQYIGFIKDFQFENPLEYRFSDTEFYRIYFVPVNNNSTKTEIPIPYECLNNGGEEWPYTVSGNNIDGFIVTVKIPELSPDYDETYLYMFGSATDTAPTTFDDETTADEYESDQSEDDADMSDENDQSDEKTDSAEEEGEIGW